MSAWNYISELPITIGTNQQEKKRKIKKKQLHSLYKIETQKWH